ncbi:hypothetical protein RND81_10G221900 [Saponaria officinalis]|uniref:BHLH domain-containing protein n=1 Tax=Saponaria officinalis TaxID=3572 RepID=A0AAW1I4Z1_SAPOF
MDPQMIGETSFSTTNPTLSEIWPFNSGECGMLGLRMGSGGFIDHLLSHRDGSLEESTVTDQSGSLCGVNVKKRRDENVSMLDSTTCSGNELEPNGKRMKTSTSREENGRSKGGSDSAKPGEKPAEPLKDYIHVRARRGQATDSHSLAERARREKISERMKMLQDLVPGTNKVIGKALVLDEIINYIQSLQRQVEFLSMKLEAVNSTMIPSISGFHSKDINQLGMPSFDPNGMMFNAQAARELAAAAAEGGRQQQSEWLHMQLGGNFERTS